MMDYLRVRSSELCPLCRGHKDQGLIACWYCYHKQRLRYGNEEAERMIEQAEASLGKSGEQSNVELNLEQ